MMDQQTWQRYIDKTCTPAERKAVLKWLQTQDAAALESLLESGWEEETPVMPAAATALLDQQLMHLMQPQRRPVVLSRWWLAAACTALLAGSLLWLQRTSLQKQPTPVAVVSRKITNTSIHVRKLTLPDGSYIWLTPKSVMEIPADYNIAARKVKLAGEAYFEIAAHTLPFMVEAGGLQTTVLGTHFNMEAYPGENITSVSLSAGKIAVQLSLANHKDSTLVLLPGVKLAYKKEQHSFATRHFSPEKETDWKQGALVLDDIPLEAAFRRLESRFHKSFFFSPTTFKTARFTATYQQEPLTVILRNMAFIHGFSYHETRDTVFIHSPQ